MNGSFKKISLHPHCNNAKKSSFVIIHNFIVCELAHASARASVCVYIHIVCYFVFMYILSPFSMLCYILKNFQNFIVHIVYQSVVF
jgi:hypothetical protein